MLHRMSELKKCHLAARDGVVGKIKDVLFDDESWTIRYLVANAGRWLPGRRVLLSPLAAVGEALEANKLPVNLTKAQIEQSPGIEADRPVSAQYQRELHTYYGWPAYWSVAPYPMAGVTPPLTPLADPTVANAPGANAVSPGDPHLRSADVVRGDKIQASDGPIGHVDDFLVDTRDWMIRFLVVDTKNWLPGKKVVITTGMIDRISWSDSAVAVHVARDAIEHSPEYLPGQPLGEDYEHQLAAFYDALTAQQR